MPVKHATEAHEGDVISKTIWNEDHSLTSLIPDATDTYNIGDAANRWNIAYINQIEMKNVSTYAFNLYYQPTDTYPILRISNNGKIYWGGGTAAPDTVLYRATANVLKTDDAFDCNSLRINGTELISSSRLLSNVTGVYIGSYVGTTIALLKLMADKNYNGKIMFREESDSYAGADIEYDGSANALKIEVVDIGPNVRQAIVINRDDGKVDIKQGLKIAGTEVLTSERKIQNLIAATFNLGSVLTFLGSTGGTTSNMGFIEFKDTYPAGDRTLQLKGLYDNDGKYKFQWYYWDGVDWIQLLEGPTQDGYVEFKGDVTLKSTSPVLKLENTSSSTAYPRLEFVNPTITYRCGLLMGNDPTLYLPYDATHSNARYIILYQTSGDQFRWFKSGGGEIMYLDYNGSLWIDGTYNTFSPELPKDWQDIDYANYLQSQLAKPHPPRDKKGRKICICGKSGVCPEHKKEFEERYGFDTSTVTAATAKLVLHLMNKISQLEDKIAQLEEKLDQTGG